ncbi:hypothetical protein Acr_09g0005170 [Actinidia rufa]|uniref:Hydroxyproline-rich glycoprotein family protein n=1 Tax=Actinidia rufa TaxID=165716 RepID=A0A7J0F5Z9_9ERIC|nr:hypothetical protein Acr_09g0005170 [Actinidia rufa]
MPPIPTLPKVTLPSLPAMPTLPTAMLPPPLPTMPTLPKPTLPPLPNTQIPSSFPKYSNIANHACCSEGDSATAAGYFSAYNPNDDASNSFLSPTSV